MKTYLSLILSMAILFTIQAQDREYYQLKVYTMKTADQEARVDEYLKNAYLPALKRQGLSNIGVFKPRELEADTLRKIYVLIPSETLEKIGTLEADINKDEQFLKDGDDYINAQYDNPPYARLESIISLAFKDMPKMKPTPLNGPRKDRIYELRSYESASEKIFQNKVDMFNAGGEILLFEELEFNAVYYSEVISGPVMPNLMYMTTFDNQADRDAHWKSFVDSPGWNEMKSLDKYQNNVSHIDIYFLYPTEYSDY